jgi:capsule polysaccharide export protein KpsE/RkpR
MTTLNAKIAKSKMTDIETISIFELKADLSHALAFKIEKMPEHKRIDFFYDLISDLNDESIRCYWLDHVAPDHD